MFASQEQINLFKQNNFNYGDIGSLYQNLLTKVPDNSTKITDSLKEKINKFGTRFDQPWKNYHNLNLDWIIDLIPNIYFKLKNIDIVETRIYYEALKGIGLSDEERFTLAFSILTFIQEESNYRKLVCSFGTDKLFLFVEGQKKKENLFFTGEAWSSNTEPACYSVLFSEGEKVFKEDFYRTVVFPILAFIDSKDKNNSHKNLSNAFKNLGGGVKIFGFLLIFGLIVGIPASISQFTGWNFQNLFKVKKAEKTVEKAEKTPESTTSTTQAQVNGNGNNIFVGNGNINTNETQSKMEENNNPAPPKKLSFIDLQRKNGVFYLSEIDKEVKNEANSRQTYVWCIGKSNNNGIVSAVLKTNCAKQGTSFQIQDTEEPQVLKSDNDECLDYNGDISNAGTDDKPIVVFKKCDPNSAKWSITKMDDSIGVFRIKPMHKYAGNVCVDLTNTGRTEGEKIQLNKCHDSSFYYNLINNYNPINNKNDNYWVTAQSWYLN